MMDQIAGGRANPQNLLFFLAGEHSGDLLGAELIRALNARMPAGRLGLTGVGGPAMREAGFRTIIPMEEFAVLGLWEVLKRYPQLRRYFNQLVDHVIRVRPKAVVLIDYPGFNLRFARKMRAAGIPVIYYVSPQLWAWGGKRIHRMPELVDLMLTLFPFEVDLYHEVGVEVEHVGHPVVDRLMPARLSPIPQALRGSRNIALLPGSRRQEVERIFPVMVDVAKRLLEEAESAEAAVPRFLIGVAGARLMPLIWGILLERGGAELLRVCEVQLGSTHLFMHAAEWGMVASGTATLEAAVMGMPMLVLYKVSRPTYEFGRRVIRVPHLSMVNILAGEEIAPEFLQQRCRAEEILPSARRLMTDPTARAAMRAAFRRVSALLGPGGAAERAAEAIDRKLRLS